MRTNWSPTKLLALAQTARKQTDCH